MSMSKVLILKDNYNSFEKYYLSMLNRENVDSFFYYKNSSILRKIMTHYGLWCEKIWFSKWKKGLDCYDVIIVFDSLHTSNLLKYIHSHSNVRIIYWHWNPVKTENEKNIIRETQGWCEHWTFNPDDALKYKMKLNNQFFFFQEETCSVKERKAFFVGADKGRYQQLVFIANQLKEHNIVPDFHVVDSESIGQFYQKEYMDYDEVIPALRNTKIVVEIVQTGQNGLTVRALEAMFFGAKLITNNQKIKECSFYKKENVYIIQEEENIGEFLSTPFKSIEREKLYPYSAEGWLNNFFDN